MREIINSTYITLDGAVADPHLWPSLGDDGSDASYGLQWGLLQRCDTVLMGRHTYEGFASVWPTRSGDPYSDRINELPKVVVSSSLESPAWHNTTVLRENVAEEIARLKERPGQDIIQYGLGDVSFLLLEHDLLDEVRLWVHPLILGRDGPQEPHFRDCPPARLRLTDSQALPNGVVVLTYRVR
jgi:dihydrofolate reductase